jgi:hypothetical protein
VFHNLNAQIFLKDVVLVVSGTQFNPLVVLHQTSNSLHVAPIFVAYLQQRTQQGLLQSRSNQGLYFAVVRDREGLYTTKLTIFLVDFLDDYDVGLF